MYQYRWVKIEDGNDMSIDMLPKVIARYDPKNKTYNLPGTNKIYTEKDFIWLGKWIVEERD